MGGLLLLYLLFSGYYASILFSVGEPVAIAMGAALLLLAVLGILALVLEIRFGLGAERLGRRLETEGGLPGESLPAAPSGRVDRAAAREAFPAYQRAAEASPEDWRAWFRLALAYDASGDRRRARWATRRAISLERSSR